MRPAPVRPAPVRRARAAAGLLSVAVLGCIAAIPARADEPPPSGATGSPRLYGFHQIGLDAKHLATHPFHLDRKGTIKVAVTAGVAGLLYVYRSPIQDRVQEHRTDSRDQFLNRVRVMGGGGVAPGLSLVSYGASFLTRSAREKETSVLLLETMAFTGIGVGLGQFVLSSHRPPDKEIDYFRWGGHGFSGDAALAACIVPVLRRQYLLPKPGDGTALRVWKYGATGALYAGAVLTAIQRVNGNRHWAPDAVLGSVTGFAVGETLVDSHDRTRERLKNRLGLRVAPHGAGLTFRF